MSNGLYDYFNHEIMVDFIDRLRDCAFTSGVLAIKAAENADAKTTAAVAYSIDGKLYSLAAQATLDLSTANGTLTIPAGGKATVACLVNAAGTVSFNVAEGHIVPDFADDVVCFGLIKLTNGTAAEITIGTTALDATDVTATYINVYKVFPGEAV